MLPPLKPGATLARLDDPVIETEHLLLRPWRARMSLRTRRGDPLSGRFITADGKPVTDAFTKLNPDAISTKRLRLFRCPTGSA